ncbi:MAG: hypothetical protein A3H96_06340 [Acidobacteria bacterium RIFCSPLOWO2_02_FULL_67_36]|nr:MAG: hypothetical protein A3H96_06340 [Acidobacteria bacterium RIFCSPLOWO2_02_FULL_67_36]OFW25902.1 MAG: hypothetical protein A3G21_15180 [Acidobacteria bacterium RIFCSPLOWO2_12_FULL_66_21]
MVQVDYPFTFGVGSLFAAAVERGLRSSRSAYFYQRALAASLIVQTVTVVWLPLYLLVNHFGFQTSHMWWHGDSLAEYPWLLPIFITGYFVMSLAGFHVGTVLVRRGQARAAWAIFLASFAFFFGWMIVQPYRTLTLGTYREWEAGNAVWISTDPGFVALLAGDFVFFVATLWWIYRKLQREAAAADLAVTSRPAG